LSCAAEPALTCQLGGTRALTHTVQPDGWHAACFWTSPWGRGPLRRAALCLRPGPVMAPPIAIASVQPAPHPLDGSPAARRRHEAASATYFRLSV